MHMQHPAGFLNPHRRELSSSFLPLRRVIANLTAKARKLEGDTSGVDELRDSLKGLDAAINKASLLVPYWLWVKV